MKIFDLKNPRLRFTIKEFDPVETAIPLFDEKPFEIVLEGTPIIVNSELGLRFSVKKRPFNS